MPDEFLKIRVLHQLARTGGTLLAKCLASMHGVVLLSEIHPKGVGLFNPLIQALRWYPGLLEQSEVDRIMSGVPSFREVMLYINQKAQARGEKLIIRDWPHLDFTGVPYIPKPGYRLTTAEVMGSAARLLQGTCVRHPLDQWLSISGISTMKDSLRLDTFMYGCRRFAEVANQIGFVRYEDFTRNPDAILRVMCERLEVDFDPEYSKRWADYENITGDVGDTGSKLREIRPSERKSIPPQLLELVSANPDYRRTCELLGYSMAG